MNDHRRPDLRRMHRPGPDGLLPPKGLVKDERGAMMLLGIFMTTIVIGMLYYLAGVGETITYRERMQDAVDSGAFAGSLLYARAMNVIVLLNMAVASVFAIAVAAYAAMLLLFAAWGAASADCNPWAGRFAGCIPALCLITCAVPQACENSDEKRDIARDVAENAQRSANAIATATRAAAIGAAFEITTFRYQPPVEIGAGLGDEMPLADERPSRVCDEILTFSGPAGALTIPPDVPVLAVSGFAYEIARPFADDCNAMTYLNQVAVSALPFTYLACWMIEDDMAGRTKKIRDGVNMGGPEFQFRTFAMAQADALPFEPNQERVELVTWGNEDTSTMDGVVGFLEEANRFSVAQSEYYFDGDDDRELWTWRMNWRSRLRRFRLGGGGASGCPGFMGTVCDGLNSAVIH